MVFGAIIKIVLLAGAIIVGIGSVAFFKLKKDNIVEEIAEDIIEDQTGIEIDLSPDTPENEQEDKQCDISYNDNITIDKKLWR